MISETPAQDERASDSKTIKLHANEGVQVALPPKPGEQVTAPPKPPPIEPPLQPTAPNWSRVRLDGATTAVNDSPEVNISRRVSFSEQPTNQENQL